MSKMNLNLSVFDLFLIIQKTLTNAYISTFASVLSFLKLTRFYLKIPVVGVEPTILTEHDFESKHVVWEFQLQRY